VAFAAYLLANAAQQRLSRIELARIASLVMLAAMLALMISMAGALPFLELLSNGHTYKTTDDSERLWLAFLQRTREAFPASLLHEAHSRLHMPTAWPWAAAGSIGLTALLTAVIGARQVMRSWGLVVVLVLGVGLTLAPPGLGWLNQLPGLKIVLSWYCYPLVVVPLCVAAGFGLQKLNAQCNGNPLPNGCVPDAGCTASAGLASVRAPADESSGIRGDGILRLGRHQRAIVRGGYRCGESLHAPKHISTSRRGGPGWRHSDCRERSHQVPGIAL